MTRWIDFRVERSRHRIADAIDHERMSPESHDSRSDGGRGGAAGMPRGVRAPRRDAEIELTLPRLPRYSSR